MNSNARSADEQKNQQGGNMMRKSCKNADELIAMVKRNILEGMSVDNAFRAAVALPRFSDRNTPHIQGLVECRLFDRILLSEESAMEPCPFLFINRYR